MGGRNTRCYNSFLLRKSQRHRTLTPSPHSIRNTPLANRSQENFHLLPQFMHSQNVVIGSSADRVCAWL